jgi:hypothetical protein
MAALDGTQFGIGAFCYGINRPSSKSHSTSRVYTYVDVKESLQSVKSATGFLNTAAAIIEVVAFFFLWIQTLLSPDIPKKFDAQRISEQHVEYAEESYEREAIAQYGIMDEVTDKPITANEYNLEGPLDSTIFAMRSGAAFRRQESRMKGNRTQRVRRFVEPPQTARVALRKSPQTVETMTRLQLRRHIERLDSRLERLATVKRMVKEVADKKYKACKHERDRASIRLASLEQMAQKRPTAEERKKRFIKAAIGQSFMCAVAAQ